MIQAGKDIENRDWSTRIRGTIAIHAAKGMTKDEYQQAMSFILRDLGKLRARGKLILPTYEELVRGSIIGMVDIVDCVTRSESPWFQGDYGFVLHNPVSLPTPIECKGALGFWDVPAGVAEQLIGIQKDQITAE